MAQISREEFVRKFENGLLSSSNRVEAPFIRVELGGYTFGVYEEASAGVAGNHLYKTVSAKYPNYVQSLTIKKINGTVNQYTLNIVYPITQDNDPNFFERIFSSVSGTRYIKISYGDFSMPNYMYTNIDGRGEEAIITDVKTQFNMQKNTISYVVSATSTATLTLSGCYDFPAQFNKKPSDIIFSVLYNAEYHLLDVFTGMTDRSMVEMDNFIARNDRMVDIPSFTNISALEYISKLVDYMTPGDTADNSAVKTAVYTLTTYDDTSDVYGGPYFKVSNIETSITSLNKLVTYTIDVGYPTANIVTDFNINTDNNWSILYDYNKSIKSSDYIKRINDDGEIEYEFSPLIRGVDFEYDEADKAWWTKVTSFPIQANITMRGLLKPAILMTYVKLNVWFFGHKHNASGYYLITGQEDNVSAAGYTTKLDLVRVAPDEELI